MKIALKYGFLITLVVVLWVVVTKFLFPLAPESKANILGPILFNLAAIVAIYLGINTKKRELVGELSFKEGLKTGVQISLVYAVSACLFFFIIFLLVGPKLMANEPMAKTYPMWQVALFAYVGLFFGALIFGLVYSTIISFLLVRRK
jgi:Na+/H+-translocating membrane pyrophosphatase